MNQTIEKNGVKYFSTSGISRQIQKNIAFLRKNLDIITEEYEKKLGSDIEKFLVDNVAEEIKLSLYDPMQRNMVYLEYCYRAEHINSFATEENWNDQVKSCELPETCLFDVFIYFTNMFADLTDDLQNTLLNDYHLDWYDFDFNLGYEENKSRKSNTLINNQKTYVKSKAYNAPVFEKAKQASNQFIGKAHDYSKTKKQVTTKQVINKSIVESNDRFEDRLLKDMKNGRKLFYVTYKDMDSTVGSIKKILYQYDKVPVRWSPSRGFVLDSLSDKHGEGENTVLLDIRDPANALSFVVDKSDENVSYIFEDFHHHIGGATSVNTSVAAIRSLIRDLSRNLKKRSEYVFFLAPSENLPIELVPIFSHLKQERGQKDLSFLSRYGYDMTDSILHAGNKPFIGKSEKIKRVIQILCQMETNNPILVGEPGVGKTALVEGLAQEITNGVVPSILRGKTIFSLNLNTLIAGSRYRGDFEERISHLLDEVKSKNREIIVFIDEIHTLLGAGSAEGAAGAEDILKSALARGDFPCIGATTYEGYELLMRDPALTRRFQKMDIPAATVDEAYDILRGVRHVFEKHHEIEIGDDALKAAAFLSEKCIPDYFLPGKAVKLLDSTSAFVKLEGRNRVRAKDIEYELKNS